MADMKDYLVQPLENGNVLISEEVIASIAALAVRDVDGVYGLTGSSNFDLSEIIGRKNLRKGIRVVIEGEKPEISCNLVVKFGASVMDVAQKVQEKIADEVTAMTGVKPSSVNVNVCGVVMPKGGARA